MDYDLLSQEEMDDALVLHMQATQRDHFLHTTNLARFKKIMADPDYGRTNPEWRKHMKENLHDATEHRILECELIMRHTQDQMPTGDRLKASKERIAARAAK